MAGRCGTAVGDFAFDPDVAEFSFYQLARLGYQLTYKPGATGAIGASAAARGGSGDCFVFVCLRGKEQVQLRERLAAAKMEPSVSPRESVIAEA